MRIAAGKVTRQAGVIPRLIEPRAEPLAGIRAKVIPSPEFLRPNSTSMLFLPPVRVGKRPGGHCNCKRPPGTQSTYPRGWPV